MFLEMSLRKLKEELMAPSHPMIYFMLGGDKFGIYIYAYDIFYLGQEHYSWFFFFFFPIF